MTEEINIIATTMSGSIKDQMKVKNIEPEFRKYFSNVKLHVVDSHTEAYSKAKELVSNGANILIAAGGAGTINSVVKGCYESGNLSDNLRIGVIRKGSADLIGKVLKISDDLILAIASITKAIQRDDYIKIDLIKILSLSDDRQRDYFIGFGGIGIFGDIPYFTENKFKKYYKGMLGFLFGDRGPFFVGAVLSSINFYIAKIFNKNKNRMEVILNDKQIIYEKLNNLIILNGDLGKHFPMAPGCSLDNGSFRVVLLKDIGLLKLFYQFAGCWTGKILKDNKLGVQIYDVKKLKIVPVTNAEYFVNVDGLLMRVNSSIEFKVVDQLKMYYGKD